MINLKTYINPLTLRLFSLLCEEHNIKEDNDYDETYTWCECCGLSSYQAWSASKRYNVTGTEINFMYHPL